MNDLRTAFRQGMVALPQCEDLTAANTKSVEDPSMSLADKNKPVACQALDAKCSGPTQTVLTRIFPAYKAVAAAGVQMLAEHYPWAFANDQELEHILAIAGDLDDPENRLRMKRWLTVQIVVDTAEKWADEIRRGLFGNE